MTMANEVVATFAAPLNRNLNGSAFANSLTIANAANATLDSFGISGRTARFPVTWSRFDGFVANPGSAVALQNTVGVGSEVVHVTFAGFDPTESASFTQIDADFTNEPQPPDSVVEVLDLEGARAVAILVGGASATGEFEVAIVGGNAVLRAVLTF
jgi:hypothetical protein